ncbi:hypothetical protein ACFCX4_17050 [Kitasatospora sp. NPDC056327]|uniref:hypothetical protein n=1 Tax=Kitasatospora sp. NPDC056327 TaxID=3345785 RepID=UPI0035D995BC
MLRPRTAAAGGALLAQLWGFGAAAAWATGTETLPEPAGRAVGRALAGAGAVPDGPSAGHPGGAVDGGTAGRAGSARPGTAREDGQAVPGSARPSDGLLGGLTDAGPGNAPGSAPGNTAGDGPPAGDAAGPAGAVPEPPALPGPVGGVLQERIRAGGLPLPGQRAAVPDAFAIASGLLDAAPAQGRPAETPAARGDTPDGPSAPFADAPGDSTRAARPGADRHGSAAPPPPPQGRPPAPAVEHPAPAGGGGTRPAGRNPGPATPALPAAGPAVPPPAAVATGAVTVAHDTAGTATAVLAPIAAGLALTGAAMYKHRGLPRGH